MDSSIRYDAAIEKFDPAGLIDAASQAALPEPMPRLNGDIELRNVSWEEDVARALRNVSMTVKGGSAVAIVGPDDAGRARLAQVISNTLGPAADMSPSVAKRWQPCPNPSPARGLRRWGLIPTFSAAPLGIT